MQGYGEVTVSMPKTQEDLSYDDFDAYEIGNHCLQRVGKGIRESGNAPGKPPETTE
jgi:hypothetical protein